MAEKQVTITTSRPVYIGGVAVAAAQDAVVSQSFASELVSSGQAIIKNIAAPTVTSVTPNTIAAGTARLILVVVGTGFGPASKVFFDNGPTDIELETLYVSPTQLVAVLPLTGIVAATYAVFVRSYKLDGNHQPSNVNQAVATVFTVTV